MKLFDTILFSLSAALLIIGVHQAILHGVQNSYFFFMMASSLFLWYTLRKKSSQQKEAGTPKDKKPKNQDKKRNAK
jgi:nicotinamide riboside transporter PnuC